MELFNIYCDESCHIETDHQLVMGLGSLWTHIKNVRNVNEDIRKIKVRHGMSKTFEIKWIKVSKSKIDFYIELINYFLSNELFYRGVIIPDKTMIKHDRYEQTHDDWYYKMFYVLLKRIFKYNKNSYNIYFDIKDIYGSKKRTKLKDIIGNTSVENIGSILVNKIQGIKSHEVEILQITDLILGATVYKNRNEIKNEGKQLLINQIEKYINIDLSKTTIEYNKKFDLLIWEGKDNSGTL